MMSKAFLRFWRPVKLLAAIFTLMLGAVVGLLFLINYIPIYLETDLLPSLARQAGLESFACDVRGVGVNHADVSDVRIGTAQKEGLRIDSIRLDFSLRGLYQRRLKRIVISHPEFQLQQWEGQWRIKGLDWETLGGSAAKTDEPAGDSESEPLPAAIDKIEIRNANLMVALPNQRFSMPFDIEISPLNRIAPFSRLEAVMRLYPADQKLICKAALDWKRKRLTLSLDADDLDLARIQNIAPLSDDIRLKGALKLRANVSATLAPLKFTDIRADLSCDQFQARRDHIVLINTGQNESAASTDENPKPAPLIVRLKGESIQTMAFTIENLGVVKPVKLDVNPFSGVLEIQPDQVRIDGDYAVNAHLPDSFSFRDAFKPVKITGRYQARADSNGNWDANLSASAEKMRSPFRQHTLNIASMQVDITGQGENDGGNIQLDAKLNDWRVANDQMQLNGKTASLEGKMTFDNLADLSQGLTFRLQTPVNGKMNDHIRFAVPTLATTGQLDLNAPSQFRCNGSVQLKKAWIKDSKSQVTISGVNLETPLSWPGPQKGKPGVLTIQKLQWKDLDLGAAKIKLTQNTKGAVFKGNYKSAVLPALKATLSGRVNISSPTAYHAQIDFKASRGRAHEAIDFQRFLPQAEGVAFKGGLRLDGGLTLRPNHIDARIQSEITDARIEHQKTGLLIEGVEALIEIPDLVNMRSGPGQTVGFERASLGKINFKKGKIQFQIESPKSLLIETGDFEWCGGHVDTPAIRIKAGVDDYAGVLYCDRLNFSQLLNQLGDVKARGQGAVNGRLPVRFAKGQISFQDGFLYSTPGQGGSIQVASKFLGGADAIDNDRSNNNAQASQIELAREALKDYTYNWVKLNLNTQGELLKGHLQMDGKPAEPLPFVYNKKMGAFTRVEAGAGSRFQGIQLNVNFSLPLNKILYYKGKLKQ